MNLQKPTNKRMDWRPPLIVWVIWKFNEPWMLNLENFAPATGRHRQNLGRIFDAKNSPENSSKTLVRTRYFQDIF
jgi:hypothetical protein